VIAALEEARIVPDIIVGTSAGSLVGALYASGLDAAQLRKIALNTEESTFGEWSITSRALLRGRRIQDFVNRSVGSRLMQNLPRKFAATATDLNDGRLLVMTTGDVGLAVRASAAVPMVFDPVTIDGREYVDGGLASPVPVRACRRLGAQFVIGVDISTQANSQRTESLPDVLMQTFTIMGQHLAAAELREADVVIRPAMGDRSSIDFRGREAVIAEGERSARARVPEMLAGIANWNSSKKEGGSP
jgi:NTE family protein